MINLISFYFYNFISPVFNKLTDEENKKIIIIEFIKKLEGLDYAKKIYDQKFSAKLFNELILSGYITNININEGSDGDHGPHHPNIDGMPIITPDGYYFLESLKNKNSENFYLICKIIGNILLFLCVILQTVLLFK